MSRYRTRRNASTQKRLDELKRLEKRKSRVKERISELTTTKRGTPRVRVDEEALRKARARKRAIDAELREAREKKERAEEKKRAAQQKKRRAPHRREAKREAPPRERRKPARKTKLSKRELEAFRKAVIREERERAKEERREERRRERAREKSRRRLQAIEDGDYVTLAEIDDISDSEAYTIIWYHESSQGVAA